MHVYNVNTTIYLLFSFCSSLFTCHDGRAIFVPANRCTADRRFADVDNSISANQVSNNHAKKFGVADCPAIYGSIPPLGKLWDLSILERKHI